jgi:predicted amidohydrolase
MRHNIAAVREITVAVVQSVAVPGDLPRAVSDHARLSIQAAHKGARLAVFPELSLTGYSLALTRADALTPDDPRLQMLQQVADANDIVIVAGAPIVSANGLHIGALCFSPRRPAVTYSKRFLHEGEDKTFTPGVGGAPLSIHDHVVGIAICADITHPEHAAETARRGANIYAASCFITPNGYAYDTNFLVGYAREHRMMVLMANFGNGNETWRSAGRSAIWSSTGELLIEGPPQGEAILIAKTHVAAGDENGAEYSSPACYLHEFEGPPK